MNVIRVYRLPAACNRKEIVMDNPKQASGNVQRNKMRLFGIAEYFKLICMGELSLLWR